MFESKDTNPEFFAEILSVVKTNKKVDSTIVIVGSGFTKDHFLKFAKEKDAQLFKKSIVHGTGQPGMNGINEAIKTGIIEQITKENRVVQETNLIEKLFSEIKKNGLATYGKNEVKNAILNGAVERLLITDTLIRTDIGEELLKLAKQNNSEFTIINTMHEAGKKIEGIGGLGALLRYKI
jgi:protein pelota